MRVFISGEFSTHLHSQPRIHRYATKLRAAVSRSTLQVEDLSHARLVTNCFMLPGGRDRLSTTRRWRRRDARRWRRRFSRWWNEWWRRIPGRRFLRRRLPWWCWEFRRFSRWRWVPRIRFPGLWRRLLQRLLALLLPLSRVWVRVWLWAGLLRLRLPLQLFGLRRSSRRLFAGLRQLFPECDRGISVAGPDGASGTGFPGHPRVRRIWAGSAAIRRWWRGCFPHLSDCIQRSCDRSGSGVLGGWSYPALCDSAA